MDRREFIDKLQRALAGGLGSSLVAENVRYYEEYIDSEIRKGKSEAEVLNALGDPRLLAKSIIEANKRAGESYGSNLGFDEEVSDDGERKGNRNATGGRMIMLPGWLIMLIVTVVVIVVIGVVTSLLAVFAPVIIAVLLVLLVIKIFQSKN